MKESIAVTIVFSAVFAVVLVYGILNMFYK